MYSLLYVVFFPNIYQIYQIIYQDHLKHLFRVLTFAKFNPFVDSLQILFKKTQANVEFLQKGVEIVVDAFEIEGDFR